MALLLPMMLAPPAVTASVPCSIESCVEARLPSTSCTAIVLPPVKASAVSSLTVCGAGTVLTGASLTELTVLLTISVSVDALLSEESTVSVSLP